jgi:Flp pilus assembly pilin Flp
MTTGACRRLRRKSERGVTLVEYALVVSLIVVVSLGAISAATDAAGDNLNEHGATAGAPDLPDAGAPTTTSSTIAATTLPVNTTTTLATVNATAGYSNPGFTTGNKVWFPSITVRGIDSATGSTMTNVTITVTWTWTERDGTARTLSQTASVLSTGVATFTLNPNPNLSSDGPNSQGNGGDRCVANVNVVISTITASGQTVNYTPGTPQQIAGPSTCA